MYCDTRSSDEQDSVEFGVQQRHVPFGQGQQGGLGLLAQFLKYGLFRLHQWENDLTAQLQPLFRQKNLLILLIRTRGKAFGFCFQTASAFVPCVCVMLWQMIVSFGTSSSAEGGIEIAWFDVMGASSPSIPFSMLLGYLFPLYIILTNLRIMKERDMQVTFFMWFAGFLEAAALAETGYRRYHGNFGWGYVLATFLVYVMTFRYFLKRNREYDYQNLEDRIFVLSGWVIFALQLFIGIYYISTFFIPVG